MGMQSSGPAMPAPRFIGVLFTGMLSTGLLVAGAAQAGVYKCPLPGGGHEYRGTPCEQGAGQEVVVRDPTRPAPRRIDPDATGAAMLQGDWCEFAVSLTVDGERDSSAPAQWGFGSSTLRYRMVGAPGTQTIPLRRDGDAFYVDDGMFGGADAAWTVHERRGNTVLVKGPMGGYYHLRPGPC